MAKAKTKAKVAGKVAAGKKDQTKPAGKAKPAARAGKRKEAKPVPFTPPEVKDRGYLVLEGVRQNNLKGISLKLPHDKITALCGPSGSGKSSLAFDTLFAEGRWRFIESLSTYTRLFLERMDRPDLDTIRNIRPSIAIEQKNPVRSSRSTVGTATEINDYLRVLFAKVGTPHCPECGASIAPTGPSEAAGRLLKEHAGEKALIGFIVAAGGREDRDLYDELLSRGFIRVMVEGTVYDLTDEKPPTNGEVRVITDRVAIKDDSRARVVEALESAFNEGGGEAWATIMTSTDSANSPDSPHSPHSPDSKGETISFSRRPRCMECNTESTKPSPILFSFNHPLGACAECKGFGNTLEYDEDKIVPDKDRSLADGAIEPWTKPHYKWWYGEMATSAAEWGLSLDKPFSKLTKKEQAIVYEGTEDFDGLDGFFEYLESKRYKLHVRVFLSRYKGQFVCTECGGKRLKKEALSCTLKGTDGVAMNIAAVSALTIEAALRFFQSLELAGSKREIAKEALKQLVVKLEFLNQTGLGYITLDRLTRTLSGGEAQRIALANQLASHLSGVLYILDEPSIGLHPRDIDMLTQQVKKLSARGNTVVLVEHDPSMIRAADHIVELGPGAGELGGRVVYTGSSKKFLSEPSTLTSLYLTGVEPIHAPEWRRKGSGSVLKVTGARGNNLSDLSVEIPLRTLTCITGVSGSGKSTLVMDTIYRELARRFGEKSEKPLEHDLITVGEHLTGVKLIDQEPIGRTPRSNPITYLGGFDEVRKHFAALPRSSSAGLTAGSFSFNVPGGRCETCKGEGVEKLEMYFLPDVYTTCSSCGGRRYKPQVLDVKYKGRNIHDLLKMTFEGACRLLPKLGGLRKRAAIMNEVGLGYMRLGQPATTLSGGEAQRLKIARELTDTKPEEVLYILDEPTTGLHPGDIKKLLKVLGRLVDSGNTVIVVEHNMDLIKTADWVIDLGPEGGGEGGRLVASGTPDEVAKATSGHTGRYLKEVLE